jgi:hypothetical protein
MKKVLAVFMFICLLLAGAQDGVNTVKTEIQNISTLQEQASISSEEKELECNFIQQSKEQFSFFADNTEYVRNLYRISQGNEQLSSSIGQIRSFHKILADFVLKDYNSGQKISETVSTSQIIIQSTLFYRSAHQIYQLQKIVI